MVDDCCTFANNWGEMHDELRDLGLFPRTMIPHDLGETSPMPGFFCYLPSLPFNPNQIKNQKLQLNWHYMWLTWNTSQWKSCRFFSLWISSWIGILRGRNYSETCHPQFRPEIWVSHKISWNPMNPPKFPIDSHNVVPPSYKLVYKHH